MSAVLNRMRARWRRFASDRSGVAMVELALITPILGLMTVGTIDYALLVTSKLAVEGAARNGASYAISHGYNSTTISNIITANTRSATFLSAVTADPAPNPWYGCANASTGVVAAATATTVCTNGLVAGRYVTASASATYTFLIPWPGLPTTFPITSSMSVRIE
jgi:Flp pilus assembly protein TadG